MARRAAKRLLIVSSDSGTGDAEGPPDLNRATSGPLGAVRSMHDGGTWPPGLDLLIISDSYGLVEPISEGFEAVPVPFTRAQNPGWWSDFISHNLNRMVAKREYTAVLALPDPHHESALRQSGELQKVDTVWGNTGVAGLAGAELLRAWLSGKKPAQKRKTAAQKAAGVPSVPAEADTAQVASTAAYVPPPSVATLQPEPPAIDPAYADLVEQSIYSDRFMLVVGSVGREDARAIQQSIRHEWSQRRKKGKGRRSVSNVVVKAARFPWAYRPASTLCIRILESIGMPAMLGSINKAVAQLAITEPGRYRDMLARIPEDESEFLADLLHLLWEASSRMDKDEIALLRAYLVDSCTPGELRRVRLPRNLELEDRYQVLRAVIKSFVGLAPGEDLPDFRRVWIWLDEAENLLQYSEHERWETVKALETLFGDTPTFVTVWLNITPGKSSTAAGLQAALENGLIITDDATAGTL